MKDFKRLLSYLGDYRRDLLIGALLVVVETFFELVIPVLMADLIDVGVEEHDLAYIVRKGVQMGICALLALVTGLLYARFAAGGAYGWGAISGRPSIGGCRAMPFPIWTGLRPPHWSPA